MNLLVLTPQLPFPPRQGTTLRNYYLLQGLASIYTVDLLSFLAPGDHLADDSPLHTICRRIASVPQPKRTASQRLHTTVSTLTPDMGLRLDSSAMHRLLHDWCQQTRYDLVLAEGLEVVQYARAVAGRKQNPQQPILVFDDHNCEYLLQQRNALTDLRLPQRWPAAAYSLVQWWKLRRYETAALQSADLTVAVSRADQVALHALGTKTAVAVVPNGIDLAAYTPAPRRTDAPATLVFTGKMDYRPNVDAVLWFANTVLPRILQHCPTARFQVVGLNPHPRLDSLRAHPAIDLTGAVPDTRPFIQQAAVYVIPMRIGGGTRFKALEALACAAPTVSTTLGVEGLGVRHGQELLVADTPEAFADATLRILNDAPGTLRQQLGAAGRRFVEAQYSWPQILPDLYAALQATQARLQIPESR